MSASSTAPIDVTPGAALNDPPSDGREPSPALTRRARDGDEEARAELVRQVYPLVLRWSRVHLGPGADAEDVAHDALVRLLRSLGSFRGESRFTSWLYRIVRNVALDRGRRRSRRWDREEELSAAEALASDEPGPAEAAEHGELLERIRTAFETLPQRQREIFHMADLQGLTSPEIAERLGIAPSTVRVALLHARRTIRSALLACGPSSGQGRE